MNYCRHCGSSGSQPVNVVSLAWRPHWWSAKHPSFSDTLTKPPQYGQTNVVCCTLILAMPTTWRSISTTTTVFRALAVSLASLLIRAAAPQDLPAWKWHLSNQSTPITSVAFAPNDTAFVTAAPSDCIRIWDVNTSIPRQVIGTSTGTIACSPDGKLIASAYFSSVKLWNSESGSHQDTFHVHSEAVTSLVFSRDGNTVISGSQDNSVKIWDTQTGSTLTTMVGHSADVNCVAISDDNQTIASGSSDGTVKLWDKNTGFLVHSFPGVGTTYTIALSPGGAFLAAAGSDAQVRVWNAATKALVATLSTHTAAVRSLVFSGQFLASASDDRTAYIWNTANWTLHEMLTDSSGPVRALAFSPDGTMLCMGSTRRVWSLWATPAFEHMRSFYGHPTWVADVATSADNTMFASSSGGGKVILWNMGTGLPIRTLVGHQGTVHTVSISRDSGLIASGGDDSRVIVWNPFDGGIIRLHSHPNLVLATDFGPNRMLGTGCYDKLVRIYDELSGEIVRTLSGHSGAVRAVQFSPTGEILASGSADGTIRLWNVQSGALMKTLGSGAESLSFSRDGSMLAATWGNTVRVWDVTSGSLLKTLSGHTMTVTGATFSRDGNLVFSGSQDGTVRVWNLLKGTLLRKYDGMSQVTSLTISADGLSLGIGGISSGLMSTQRSKPSLGVANY
ncbi:MAG: hypothetical protein HONBIEJF_00713 [Fimbriimonadaceae bacterium]|nr:hypothetical protein [Fimbriimonadaceae bacterium]